MLESDSYPIGHGGQCQMPCCVSWCVKKIVLMQYIGGLCNSLIRDVLADVMLLYLPTQSFPTAFQHVVDYLPSLEPSQDTNCLTVNSFYSPFVLLFFSTYIMAQHSQYRIRTYLELFTHFKTNIFAVFSGWRSCRFEHAWLELWHFNAVSLLTL